SRSTGVCSDCASDGQYPTGQTCGFDGVCSGTTVIQCTSNADCPSGERCNLDDADVFGFCARVGDIIMTNVDSNPLRDQTPYRAGLALYDPGRAQLYFVSDTAYISSNASGAGDLASPTPFGPSQAIVHHRATVTGLYRAVVTGQP